MRSYLYFVFLVSVGTLLSSKALANSALEDLPDSSASDLVEEGPKEDQDIFASKKTKNETDKKTRILTPQKEDLPPEILELEDRFKAVERTENMNPGYYKNKAQRDEALIDPGAELPPPEQFSRVPLRDPMSDENWKQFASEQLEKIYRMHKGDTLWKISELLFGNPHLWPKVWQLNADLQNPHIVGPGYVLQFSSGSTRAAPQFSIRGPFTKEERLPLESLLKKLSPEQIIEGRLKAQFYGKEPPVKYYLLDNMPSVEAKIQKPKDSEHMFYAEGDELPLRVRDGDYTLLRVRNAESAKLSAYRTRWVGDVRVQEGRAKVLRAFTEIGEGDLVTQKKFAGMSLKVEYAQIPESQWKGTFFVPLTEGYSSIQAENMILGIRFAGSLLGPSPGAILKVQDKKGEEIGSVLVVDRDGAVGTGWVLQSKREISVDDVIR